MSNLLISTTPLVWRITIARTPQDIQATPDEIMEEVLGNSMFQELVTY